MYDEFNNIDSEDAETNDRERPVSGVYSGTRMTNSIYENPTPGEATRDVEEKDQINGSEQASSNEQISMQEPVRMQESVNMQESVRMQEPVRTQEPVRGQGPVRIGENVRSPYMNRMGEPIMQPGQVPPMRPPYMNGVASQSPEPKPKKEKNKAGISGFWKKLFGTIALGVIFGITTGVTLYFVNSLSDNTLVKGPKDAAAEVYEQPIKEVTVEEKQKPVEPAVSGTTNTADQTSGSLGLVAFDVSKVVENVMPSVVSITGNYAITSQDFWGQLYSRESSGSGSGIIISQDEKSLLIATNNHVVENAKELSVQFIDGTVADARVKGTDSNIDLAVIIVDLSDLTAETRSAISVAVLGDSSSLKVGEAAIAIGNALGYGQSVTAGVISAVDRQLELPDGSIAEGLIQTDAAINPGNSGGALVNAYGEVIGINSSKIGGTTVDGVGFAIPISSAEPILDDIVTSADRVKVAKSKVGYLGIGGVTVTDEASNMYGIPVGVVVRQVYEGTGAEAAGIQTGDVIVSVAGKKITSMEELKAELEYHETGESVAVEVYRINEGEYVTETLNVVLIGEKEINKAN